MPSASCQKCRQPLNLTSIEDSLAALTPSTYDLLSQSERYPLPQPPPAPSSTGISSRLAPSLRPLYNVAGRTPLGAGASSAGGMGGVVRVPAPTPPPPSSAYTAYAPNSHGGGNAGHGTGAQPHLLGPGESFVVLPTPSIPSSSTTAGAPHQHGASSSSSPSSSALAHPSNTTTPLTPRLTQLSTLYSTLSLNSSIDHPLCVECMDTLLGMMNRELEEGKKERERLLAFERDVIRRREEAGQRGEDRDSVEREIVKRKKQEKEAIADLKLVEAEREALDVEKAALEAEEAALALEEEAFWRDHAQYQIEAAALRDRTHSLQTRYEHDVRELDKLQKTNVYNDAFCIGQEAGFGTINGLRLGRLPNIPVEWPEINAAWGHTLLLLHTIARKFGFTFESYKLVPVGSFSKIEKLTGGKDVYELYGSGDFAVTRLLQNRRFDMAMVAFLDCLRQLSEWVMQRDRGLKLPHLVVKDKIGDVSIKLQFGSDETWTRALRHVLLDLKILLGRASL